MMKNIPLLQLIIPGTFLIVMVSFGIGIFVYLQAPDPGQSLTYQEPTNALSEIKKSIPREDIRGYFYLNLRPKDSPVDQFEALYRIEDLGRSVIFDSHVRDFSLQSNGAFATFVYNPAFLEYPDGPVDTVERWTNTSQVHFLYRGTLGPLGDLDYRFITTSEHVNKRDPQWSPDDKHLVFSAQQSTVPIPPPEEYMNFDIFVTDTQGNMTKIANGAHPRWIDDTTIIFLKEDGIYKVHIDEKLNLVLNSEVKILDSINRLGWTSSIDVSRSGTYLAWTDPANEELFVYEIGQEKYELTLLSHQKNIKAYTPVIGEDNSAVAVFLTRVNQEVKNELAVFQLEDLTSMGTVVTLEEYDPWYTKLSEWKMFWGSEEEFLREKYDPSLF